MIYPNLKHETVKLIYVMETPQLAIYSHLTDKKYHIHGNTIWIMFF